MEQAILITSGKGGAGKSVVCAGLGEALARQGKRVLLLEGSRRSLDVMLGVSDSILFDFSDVAGRNCDLADAMVAVGETGLLHLVCAPIAETVPVDAQLCREFFQAVAPHFDHVLIEADGMDRQTLSAYAAAAKRAVLVCAPDRISARASRVVSDALFAEHLSDIRLCVNKLPRDFEHQRTIPDLDWLVDNVCAQLIAVIPYDKALSAGPIGHSISLSNVSKLIFDNFAQRILGNYIDLLIE
ncbi:MAG: hypothetical protein E7476_15000 [Ruminococcaceae bacterium]|nr:hypothetical protein [Oscillospiraceae bacterium]